MLYRCYSRLGTADLFLALQRLRSPEENKSPSDGLLMGLQPHMRIILVFVFVRSMYHTRK